ncbi:MAG: hypothetical protein NVS9B10_23030 [Nevskia sp.]
MTQHRLTSLRPQAPAGLFSGRAPAALAAGLLLATPVGRGALASEARFSPYAQTNVTYDSNVFRVASNAALPVIEGRQVRDDIVFANTLGANAAYDYAEQQVHANVEGRRYDYLDLTSLSHFEYLVSGGINYQLLSRVTGTIDYRESRRQSRFEDRNDGRLNTRLNFDRDRNGGISTRFLATNDWALDAGFHLHELSTPVIGASTLKLTENNSNVGLSYLGISHLTAGLAGYYTDGHYSGTAAATSFKQYSGSAIVNYSTSEISKFSLSGGYTRREDSGVAPIAGFTGEASYTWDVSAKSLTSFRAFRRISSYAVGDNTIIETGLGNESRWRATEKLELELTYDYSHVKFKNPGLAGSFEQGRTDQIRTAGLRLIYKPLDWLEVSTIGFYSVRRSSLSNHDFNAATVSFNLIATLNKY